MTAAIRLRRGARVAIMGDCGIGVFGRPTLDPIPDGEITTVFEDYGQVCINVMRGNGQIRAVARPTVRPL